MIAKAFILSLLATAPTWGGIETQVAFDSSEPQEINQITIEDQLHQGPTKTSDSLGVKITADSGIVFDRESGKVLFSKSPNTRLAMASITKVMTVITALESGKDLQEEVVVAPEAANLIGARIKLEPNETIRFEDLLKGAMISSGNDAALAIAYHVGDGDVEAFIAMMNENAKRLGLKNTQFKNPHGLDQDGHYSTAEDIGKLFDHALENENFRKYISTKTDEAHALDRSTVHKLKNTNRLLDGAYPYMIGAKTGYTDNAGFCLVSVSSKDENEIITVVLGSDYSGNQFQDSKALIEWSFNNYRW